MSAGEGDELLRGDALAGKDVSQLGGSQRLLGQAAGGVLGSGIDAAFGKQARQGSSVKCKVGQQQRAGRVLCSTGSGSPGVFAWA